MEWDEASRFERTPAARQAQQAAPQASTSVNMEGGGSKFPALAAGLLGVRSLGAR